MNQNQEMDKKTANIVDILSAVRANQKATSELMAPVMDMLSSIMGSSTENPGLLTKLQSRKFILTVISAAVGAVTLMISVITKDSTPTFVGTAILLASIAVYIVTEGGIDKARQSGAWSTASLLAKVLFENSSPEAAIKEMANIVQLAMTDNENDTSSTVTNNDEEIESDG